MHLKGLEVIRLWLGRDRKYQREVKYLGVSVKPK